MKEKYSFKKVEPTYTGGGIYCYIGKVNDEYFLASDLFYDVTIIDTDPFEEDYEDLWYDDWQRKHLVRYLDDKESIIFFKKMIKYIQKNEPEGNYSMGGMDDIARELNEMTKGGDLR